MDLFALATVPAGPDEAGEPPPTNFYTLRDNLGDDAPGRRPQSAQAFRAEFDPYNILPTYAAAAGLELDELCRHMGRDDGPDPLAEAASR
jgi:hypothetical protein